MNLNAATTLIALATVTLSFGCATDPNKEVRAADAAHANEVKAEGAAEDKLVADQRIDHAELDSEHAKQDSQLDAKVASDSVKYEADRKAAEANVVEARKAFRIAASARLEQIDAKATELERKRKAKKAVEPAIATLRADAALVRDAVMKLDAVTDAKWFNTKQEVDASIATLESDASAIEARL